MQFSTETLFYDGNCSLCAHEIALLRRFKDNELSLVNIHQADGLWLKQLGTSKQEMLQVLHLLNRNGEFSLGLDATAKAWSHTIFGWVFAILRWPVIKNVADRLYQRWAVRRACKLGYDACSIDFKPPQKSKSKPR